MNATMPQLCPRKFKASRWIKCPYPRVSPQYRLVCFSHAGGTAAGYHNWGKIASEDMEVWAIELPGHGSRFSEPTQDKLVHLALQIAEELKAAGLLELPFALFGHSLGARLAFEVARVFRGNPRLTHLFVSGCDAPQHRWDHEPLHSLSDDQFLQAMVERYEGIPAELLREQELLKLVLPILRADMRMIETYRYEEGAPLCCPITALAGEQDTGASADEMKDWRELSNAGFDLLSFPGGHFFLQGVGPEIIAAVERYASGTDPLSRA